MTPSPPDTDHFARAAAEAKKSPAYLAQERRLVAIQHGFSAALAVVWLMATRSKDFSENSLSFAFVHDAFQTMAAVTFLAAQGAYAPAKRELRYFLESAAKHTYVDLNCGTKSLGDRIAFLESSVPPSSVDFIRHQPFFGLSQDDEADFKGSVISHYKRLSAYVHRSPTQLRQELSRMGGGAPEAKLVAAELERFNRDCFAVYDIAVFLQFQSLGPGLSGDVFVYMLDSVKHWPFHRGKFCRKLSQFYDYKYERQARATAGQPLHRAVVPR